jgi:superfamily II DNA or RNA helicase
MQLYDYQVQAVANVRRQWASGKRSVCLVAPTGSGKTVIGAALADQGRVLWCVHRRELAAQAIDRLSRTYGREHVGAVVPGLPESPRARIQIGMIETLLRRGLPPADVIVLDEAHHYMAPKWRALMAQNTDARVVGLTATPERADGEPLGDIFESMVTAASYSQLVSSGVLVPWTIYAPSRFLGHDYAMDPLEAWRAHAGGRSTFAFFTRVIYAESEAARLRSRGITAGIVEGEMNVRLRAARMAEFRGGTILVLTTVYALTEGVDVPDAGVVVLGRGFHHRSGFIQACGRAGRSSEGKTHAVLIDLCGASLRHGSPVDDVAWSLTTRREATTERDDVEPTEREFSPPGITGDGLGLTTASTFIPEGESPTVFVGTARPRAKRVDDAVDDVARRKGAKVAAVIRTISGGLAE